MFTSQYSLWLASFCPYEVHSGAVFIKSTEEVGVSKKFLGMHEALRKVQLIAVEPQKYGYLIDIACSTAQDLMCYACTTPVRVTIYGTLAPILRFF